MTSVQELKAKTAHMPPVDQSVVLPAAIRAAASRASELHKNTYDPTPDNGGKEDDLKAGEQGNGGTEGEQEKANAEAAEQAEARKKAAAKPVEGAPDYEQLYKSLKGRWDVQQADLRSMTSRLGQLESQLEKQVRVEQPPSELKFGSVTDKDREDFGEDFLDAAARAAEERVGPYIKTLEDRIKQLGGSIDTVTENSVKSSQQNMLAYLDQNMPDWRTLNRDEKFLEWVHLPDPYSGVIRVNMMRAAHEKGEGQRVLQFFTGFLRDEAASDPAKVIKPETPAKGKVPLSDFAAPGRAKAPAATEVPGEKETISQAQIAKFYSDVANGKYRGNEAEKERLEAMIFSAQAEGRII